MAHHTSVQVGVVVQIPFVDLVVEDMIHLVDHCPHRMDVVQVVHYLTMLEACQRDLDNQVEHLEVVDNCA